MPPSVALLVVLPTLLSLHCGVWSKCADSIPAIDSCSSCAQRCGEISERRKVGNTHKLCSCDASCVAYSDCCYDFSETCPKQHNDGKEVFGLKRAHGSTCKTWLIHSGKEVIDKMLLTVDMCPNGTLCRQSSDLTEMHLSIPITSYYRSVSRGSLLGIHYVNYECAKCNYAHYLADYNEPWGVWLGCDKTGNGTDHQPNLQALLQIGCHLKSFNLSIAERKGVLSRPCEVAKSSCNAKCSKTSELVRNCTEGIYQSYTLDSEDMMYRNPYCAYCQNIKTSTETAWLSCEPRLTTTTVTTTRKTTTTTRVLQATRRGGLPEGSKGQKGPVLSKGFSGKDGGIYIPPVVESVHPRSDHTTTTTPSPPADRFEGFSLQVLVNFNEPRSSQLRFIQRNPCSEGELWIQQETACRTILCPDGFSKVGVTCLQSTISLNSTNLLTFKEAIDADDSMKYIEQNEWRLLHDFQSELGGLLHNYTDALKKTNTEFIDVVLTNSSMIDMILDGDGETYSIAVTFFAKVEFYLKSEPFNITAFVDSEKEAIGETLKNLLVRHLLEFGIDLEGFKTANNSSLVFSGPVNVVAQCKLVSYNASEYIQDSNGTITIIATNTTFTAEMYESVSGNSGIIRVCLEFTESKVQWITFSSGLSGAPGLVTVVLTSISIVCLAVRLCLQPIIPYYQSFAGWLQFNLCLSLCLAFVSLLASGTAGLFTDLYPVCLTIAAFMYWMFLAAFAWMLTIAINTWSAFRPSSAFQRASEQSGVWRYALCTWLLPLGLVGVVVGIDFTHIDPRYRPMLGMDNCWFNERLALLVYFGIPIACSMLLSTVFYALTINALHRSQSSVQHSLKKKPSNLRIYISLFVVMGISWVLSFAAAFIQLPFPFQSTLWFLFVILNASQGIFIFIFFVCKKHIFNELKRKFAFFKHSDKKTKSQLSSLGSSSSNIDSATKSTDI